MNLKIEVEREKDGRWIAEAVEVPGCLAYGRTRADAIAKVKAVTTRMLAGPPGTYLNLEEDSPELEAELLKAAKGPFTPWRPEEFKEIAERALREHRAKKQK
jgi:predicted RNase H-like HicB family nuclease